MNRDWNKLKKSSNGLPTYESFLPYILEVLKTGEEATGNAIKTRVFDFLNIPENVRNQEYPNTTRLESILGNRLSFAFSDLVKANAITRPKRAVYKITKKGETLLKKYGETLTKDILKDQPEYKEFITELEQRNERDKVKPNNRITGTIGEIALDDEEEDYHEVIDKLVKTKNNEVAAELLNKLRETDPIFFEKLVVKLLDAMGYSGKHGSAEVTTHSNDGGIDGIINQDPLGTSTVYLQVKRYAEKNIIGRPAIQGFYGALASVNADRGVFITTSSFSAGAQEFARNQGIVLIDGIQLTELMVEYKVGVETAQSYTVYQINYDDFESVE